MVDGNANRDCQSKGLVWYRIRKYVSCKDSKVQIAVFWFPREDLFPVVDRHFIIPTNPIKELHCSHLASRQYADLITEMSSAVINI